VFVLEEAGARRGAVPLAELFVATRDTRLNALMQRRPPCVSAGSDHETAGSLAIRGELAVVAAVDDAGRFLGVLPPCEIVRVTLAPI
jgi:magnesium transporter